LSRMVLYNKNLLLASKKASLPNKDAFFHLDSSCSNRFSNSAIRSSAFCSSAATGSGVWI